MAENLLTDMPQRTTREQATRHLFDTLRACRPIDLRDSVDAIVWDAQEYADLTSTPVVLDSFTCKELALASMRYGTTAVVEPVSHDTLVHQFESARFRKFQAMVCDRIQQPEARSLLFFSQGVKLGSVTMRAKRTV